MQQCKSANFIWVFPNESSIIRNNLLNNEKNLYIFRKFIKMFLIIKDHNYEKFQKALWILF